MRRRSTARKARVLAPGKNKECRIGNTKGYQLKKDKSEAVEVNWRVMLLFQFLQKLPLK